MTEYNHEIERTKWQSDGIAVADMTSEQLTQALSWEVLLEDALVDLRKACRDDDKLRSLDRIEHEGRMIATSAGLVRCVLLEMKRRK